MSYDRIHKPTEITTLYIERNNNKNENVGLAEPASIEKLCEFMFLYSFKFKTKRIKFKLTPLSLFLF